jgi:hypothetical protein
MLLVTAPLLALIALLGFLFDVLYFKQPAMPTANVSANAMLYHDAMYSYAFGTLLNSVTAPYLINTSPPYFENINYTAMGDYQSQILYDATTSVNYLVTSFNVINGSKSVAETALNTIAQKLQLPRNVLNQHYQVKIALTNNNCTATIVNVGLNVIGNNIIESAVYAPIFNRICQSATANPIKANVIMEPLQ